MAAAEIKGKIYVFPANARHLLIIEDKRIRRIELKELTARKGAFFSYWYNEKYIFYFHSSIRILSDLRWIPRKSAIWRESASSM